MSNTIDFKPAADAIRDRIDEQILENVARDAKDNRTLGEIRDEDYENFKDLLATCTDQSFPSKVYAFQFRMHCVEKAFQDLGFSPQKMITSCTDPNVAMEFISQQMLLRDIVCEDWSNHPDRTRRGMYLYKGGEIAYFIALVRQSGTNFIVKSNVKFN